MRIGMGYDVHRLQEGCKLIMGGVEIPYEKGLLGHSDAEIGRALWRAVSPPVAWRNLCKVTGTLGQLSKLASDCLTDRSPAQKYPLRLR